jgi:hypothetical protein
LFLNYRRNEDEAKYLFLNYRRKEDEAKYSLLDYLDVLRLLTFRKLVPVGGAARRLLRPEK